MIRSGVVHNVVTEVRRSLRNPSRIRKLVSPEKRRALRGRLLTSRSERSLDSPWVVGSSDGIARREYKSYEEYVRHQRSKLSTLDLREYEMSFQSALRERLATLDVAKGASALCLGARLGAEVRAFKDLGFFAVGIDLNPGEGNAHVLPGDFHALQFPDRSVDVVYSNSLDHALDVSRVLDEALRILKPGGLLVLELMAGADDGSVRGFFESTFWESADDVLSLPQLRSLACESRVEFDAPWRGLHVRLRRPPSTVPGQASH